MTVTGALPSPQAARSHRAATRLEDAARSAQDVGPRLVPVTDAQGVITDIKAEYPTDMMEQMLEYGEKFSFLPDEN